eukprot:gene12753-3734_t
MTGSGGTKFFPTLKNSSRPPKTERRGLGLRPPDSLWQSDILESILKAMKVQATPEERAHPFHVMWEELNSLRENRVSLDGESKLVYQEKGHRGPRTRYGSRSAATPHQKNVRDKHDASLLCRVLQLLMDGEIPRICWLLSARLRFLLLKAEPSGLAQLRFLFTTRSELDDISDSKWRDNFAKPLSSSLSS